MMTRMNLAFGIRIAVVIAMLLLILCGQVHAAWVGSEGDEWLKWDITTRQAYFGAYVTGMLSGYGYGCEQGIFAVKPKMKGLDVGRYARICMSHSPISNRDSSKMIDEITEFYQKYPEKRFIYISDIIRELYSGLSIEQIHEHYAGTSYASIPVK
ncbi:MAG TPA: hypothetical protein VKF63_11435 [Terracidiphilus sp.]|nr:hypothetical protein [Terracidiphilus sp.]